MASKKSGVSRADLDKQKMIAAVQEEVLLRGICIFTYDKNNLVQRAAHDDIMKWATKDWKKYGFFACYDDKTHGVSVVTKRTPSSINGVMVNFDTLPTS